MKKRNIFPIGFKLIFIISIILTGSLLGLSYIATYFFQDDTLTRIKEVTKDKSQIIALKVNTDLNSINDKANIIAASFSEDLKFDANLKTQQNEDVFKKASNITSVLKKLLVKREKEILYVAIAEQNGDLKVLESLRNEALIKNILEKDIDFNQIINSESTKISKAFAGISEVHNSSQYFQSPVLCISFPYARISMEKVSKILIVYFSMDTLTEAVRSYTEYKTYVVNGDGELIAHPDSRLVLQNTDMSRNAIVTSMLKSASNNKTLNYTDEDGNPQIGSFRKIETADIGVISTVNRDIALEQVYKQRKRNIYITIIVLMISVMVVYVFAKTLTSPIKKLVIAANKIKDGDYNLTVKASTRDEIGELTDSFVEMGKGLEEREKMKEAFGKFVNKEIADLAMKGEIKLGGERKKTAIFFSDIRSFTAISEKLQPEEVVEFLNEYMTAMVDCVNKTNGVVDKYIGDAIMAVWGTPVSHGNDTENAVNGALMMREALIEFNKGRGSKKKPIIKIGCGINTGPVLAGQIGSHERMEYTVIGDAVNLASRIEALNKPFGTDILISADSYKEVSKIFNCEAMQKIKVKGKSQPQQIYAVIGRKDDPNAYKSLKDVRKALGIKDVDTSKVNPDEKEEKFEIVD